ncbi:hypothetical protein [Microbacterium sp. YJN-G]|uniref:hypothetical protein n=1 Tax=Microbacterium sp. YJN-G TaxID=2763257 RepID=UPI001877AC89|nr:hypothetical protein [Microbacterium sp. YJN-G]
MKKTAVGTALALMLVLGGASAAMAGEYTGNGGDVPGGDKAHSACHFSGRDLPDDVEGNPMGFDDDAITDGHVQNYGMLVRAGMKGVEGGPGVACRGNVMHEG